MQAIRLAIPKQLHSSQIKRQTMNKRGQGYIVKHIVQDSMQNKYRSRSFHWLHRAKHQWHDGVMSWNLANW